jgi:putative SOS response-associated peptidase YedK
MCGRFVLHSRPDVVALYFGLSQVPAYAPRYNIAPGAQVLVVRGEGAALARWGLVPHWAKDPSIGAKMINARAETAAHKPAFRDAYRLRRCLIPANGFYEWQRGPKGKQPYCIVPARDELFAFAGLWERWRDLETCTILTTEANEAVRPIHDRMPVIVARESQREWLQGREDRLSPCPPGAVRAYPVGAAVNDARNDSPELTRGAD